VLKNHRPVHLMMKWKTCDRPFGCATVCSMGVRMGGRRTCPPWIL